MVFAWTCNLFSLSKRETRSVYQKSPFSSLLPLRAWEQIQRRPGHLRILKALEAGWTGEDAVVARD